MKMTSNAAESERFDDEGASSSWCHELICCIAPHVEDDFDIDMASEKQRLLCVKQVNQDMPESNWNETMPLPGDIIDGVAEEEFANSYFVAKHKSELSCHLGRLNRRAGEVWVRVRRGNASVKLRVRVVPEACAKLQRKFTIRAAEDERHVALLGELTADECSELQEMSRRVVNVVGFQRKWAEYEWKKKVGTFLPHPRSTVLSSVLFVPLSEEQGFEATTARSMAWFSAAVTCGVPLVFVNIQTEQIIAQERSISITGGSGQTSRRELCWGRQHNSSATIHILQGIRLWFLPGLAELPILVTPLPGETRFGMDIKRTDEGFICIYSVTKGLAADRAGLGQMCELATASRRLMVISRLEGKNLMPSSVSSTGLIHCCDHNDVKETLATTIDQMDGIQLHIMAWPGLKASHHPSMQAAGLTFLWPPQNSSPTQAILG